MQTRVGFHLPELQMTPKSCQRLLLLCDGSSKIVFAHGDALLFRHSLSQIMHKKLFSLMFTSESLLKLREYGERGLIQPPHTKRSFTLELVKPSANINEFLFNYRKEHYVSKLEFRCSLTRVKFSNKPLQQSNCSVKRSPLTLLDQMPSQQFMTLVEVTPAPISTLFNVNCSFKDYVNTIKRQQENSEGLATLKKDKLEEVD